MTEEQLQAKCFLWFWETFPGERRMLYHTDNNSQNAVTGARKKALGVVKGVADFTLILEDSVVFIELKTDKGYSKPEQVDFRQKVLARRHMYYIIRNFEDFKTLIYGFSLGNT